MSCEFCNKFVLDDKAKEWRHFAGENALRDEEADCEMRLAKFYEPGSEPGFSLDVKIEAEWVETTRIIIEGKNNDVKKPISYEDTAIFFDISFCPVCGRDLKLVDEVGGEA